MSNQEKKGKGWETEEYKLAIKLADRLLDEPYADPDDDLRTLARQFLRAVERTPILLSVQRTQSILAKVREMRPLQNNDCALIENELLDELEAYLIEK